MREVGGGTGRASTSGCRNDGSGQLPFRPSAVRPRAASSDHRGHPHGTASHAAVSEAGTPEGRSVHRVRGAFEAEGASSAGPGRGPRDVRQARASGIGNSVRDIPFRVPPIRPGSAAITGFNGKCAASGEARVLSGRILRRAVGCGGRPVMASPPSVTKAVPYIKKGKSARPPPIPEENSDGSPGPARPPPLRYPRPGRRRADFRRRFTSDPPPRRRTPVIGPCPPRRPVKGNPPNYPPISYPISPIRAHGNLDLPGIRHARGRVPHREGRRQPGPRGVIRGRRPCPRRRRRPARISDPNHNHEKSM